MNLVQIPSGKWSIDPEFLQRAQCGYVGLMNQGATCYMNSILQQFFMIPAFRNDMLHLQVIFNGEDEKNDSVLYQLQVIFSYLQVIYLELLQTKFKLF